MSENDDFPALFDKFSKLMFGPFDALKGDDIHRLRPPLNDSMNDDSRWKANMSLRDQLLINAPPSTSSSDVDDTSHSNYKETPSFPLWGDSFNHDQQRVGAAVQDFPIFQGGGLYSVMDDFFGQQFDTPFTFSGTNLHVEMDERKDSDLDNDVRGEGLDIVLRQQHDDDDAWQTPRLRNNHQHFHGFHQTKSIIRRSDGSSEERIVKRSSDGHQQITTIIEHADGSRDVTTQQSTDEQEPPQQCIEERSDLSTRRTVPIFGLLIALREIFSSSR